MISRYYSSRALVNYIFKRVFYEFHEVLITERTGIIPRLSYRESRCQWPVGETSYSASCVGTVHSARNAGRFVAHAVGCRGGGQKMGCKMKCVSAHIYGDAGTTREGASGLQRNK